MTYSICTTDGTRHGIAIATKAPAVGGLAPFLSPNGAVCTQSIVNVPLGPKAVTLQMERQASTMRSKPSLRKIMMHLFDSSMG
ncbi:DUF1028 domain-containing protein [Halomarina halobia]|uniref:DUF1028 domain-containing protein n=1 Tax=Halomarina halobia TaxID=3033386 RepID=UPI0034A12E5D